MSLTPAWLRTRRYARLNEVLYLFPWFNHAEMPFEENIGLQIQEPSQRIQIPLLIRQEIRMQRPLKVLAEKYKLTVNLRHVHH